MPRYNKYTYDNRNFSSIKALAQYAGVNEKTLCKRLQRGMSVEEACTKQLFNCRYYPDNGVKKSLTQLCADHGKDVELVRNRLNRAIKRKYNRIYDDAISKECATSGKQ